MKIIALESRDYGSKVIVEFNQEEMGKAGIFIGRGYSGRDPKEQEIIAGLTALLNNSSDARAIAMNEASIAGLAGRFLKEFEGLVSRHSKVLAHGDVPSADAMPALATGGKP